VPSRCDVKSHLPLLPVPKAMTGRSWRITDWHGPASRPEERDGSKLTGGLWRVDDLRPCRNQKKCGASLEKDANGLTGKKEHHRP
jgi:hypothetical protein